MFLVCGEALFDLFFEDSGDSGGLKFDARVGGSPFNVAIGLARLGVRSALLTGISNDLLGEKLKSILIEEDVCPEYLIRNEKRTTLSLVGLNSSGSPSYSFYGTDSADCSILFEQLPEITHKLSGLHFGSYSTVVEPVATTLTKLVKSKSNYLISYDPNVRPTIEPDMDIWRAGVEKFARYADLIKISAEDYSLLYPNKSLEETVQRWLDYGVKLIVLTNGHEKIKAWNKIGCELQIQPPIVSTKDTVGAGDSFQAALLNCLIELNEPKTAIGQLEKLQLDSMLNYAATAAALTCTKVGADLPHHEEINSMIEK